MARMNMAPMGMSYDGIAVIETLDPAAGLIVLHIAPGCEPEVAFVLKDLKKDILMERAEKVPKFKDERPTSNVEHRMMNEKKRINIEGTDI